MTDNRLLIENIIKDDEHFHLARVTIQSRKDVTLHSHNFAEILWVENGSGLHQINGQRIKLTAGNLVMMRPDDEHAFISSRQGLIIMNIAFRTEIIDFLKNRYFYQSENYFWTPDKLPAIFEFDISVIRRISVLAEEIWHFTKSKLHLESFLLFVFRQIIDKEYRKYNENIPVWLQTAIQEYNSPAQFTLGVGGFVRLCNKNIDHINRTIRKHLNKTLTELVNELRMNYAAKELSLTNTPIKTIAGDCGFENMGHFYKVFKKACKQTPRQFRKIARTIL